MPSSASDFTPLSAHCQYSIARSFNPPPLQSTVNSSLPAPSWNGVNPKQSSYHFTTSSESPTLQAYAIWSTCDTPLLKFSVVYIISIRCVSGKIHTAILYSVHYSMGDISEWRLYDEWFDGTKCIWQRSRGLQNFGTSFCCLVIRRL